MRKLCLSLLFIFIFSISCYAQDSVTITTYYPAPYGVYQKLKLEPEADGGTGVGVNCDAEGPGAMYYDTEDNQILYCEAGAPNATWQKMGGGSHCPIDWTCEYFNNNGNGSASVYCSDNEYRIIDAGCAGAEVGFGAAGMQYDRVAGNFGIICEATGVNDVSASIFCCK